jgi:hypothetical protein
MQRLERLSVQSETVVRSRQFRAQQRAGGRRGGLSRSLVSTLLLLLVRSPLVLRRSGEAPLSSLPAEIPWASYTHLFQPPVWVVQQ